jgi:hypothetical protein
MATAASTAFGWADRRRMMGELTSLLTLPVSALIGKKRLKSDESRWAAIVTRWSSLDTTTVKSANALNRSSFSPHRRVVPFCLDLAMIEVRIHNQR